MSKVLIIGAGFGGLAAAVRLAARGHDVEIFEKQDKPGGKAYVLEVDGFRFDTGPTVITAPFLFDDLWRAKLAEEVGLEEPPPESRRQREWTAVHEAGHFVISYSLLRGVVRTGVLTVRLSGAASAVQAAQAKLGGEALKDAAGFWQRLRDQATPFFDKRPLWRLAVRPTAGPLELGDAQWIEWGGAVRWLASDLPAAVLRDAEEAGLVLIRQEERLRDPFATRSFPPVAPHEDEAAARIVSGVAVATGKALRHSSTEKRRSVS